MSRCRAAQIERIAFRMESFVCAGEGAATATKKLSRTIRRAKGGLNSELRAVCDGAVHRAATEVRLSLGSPNILAKRSDLSSFRSLDVRRVCMAPAHPDPLDFDGRPLFRQGHRPPRPTLSVAPAGLKPGESGQETQEESHPDLRRKVPREVVPETRLPGTLASA